MFSLNGKTYIKIYRQIIDMKKDVVKEKIRERIKERGEIKSSHIYNAFRRTAGTTYSDRTLSRKVKELEDEGVIERKGYNENTRCIWKGDKETVELEA